MRPDLWKAELQRREAARKAAEEAAEQAARRPVERSCASCGVFGTSFGFGVFRNRSDGMWSCADPECRAAVEAMTVLTLELDAEPRGCALAQPQPNTSDLFGNRAA